MEKLGIDPMLIGVQILNFGILMLILKKVLYKPVIDALKKREADLSINQKRDEELNQKAEKFEIQKNENIAKSQKELKTAISEATIKADEKKKEIIKKANDQAKTIIEKATKEASRQQERLEKSFDKKVQDAARIMAQKALSESLDTNTKKKSVEAVLKRLKKS